MRHQENRVHHLQGWIPRLERKLEIAADTAHPDFRCFFSAEPINGAPHAKIIPESILQNCIKVGVGGNLASAHMCVCAWGVCVLPVCLCVECVCVCTHMCVLPVCVLPVCVCYLCVCMCVCVPKRKGQAEKLVDLIWRFQRVHQAANRLGNWNMIKMEKVCARQPAHCHLARHARAGVQ